MSQRTSIVSGVINTPFTFDPPVTKDRQRLVLYNQSPFVLIVETGSVTTYCPAFTADIYEIGKYQQKIQITPLSSIGSDSPLANQIFGVFFTEYEELPFETFPASLFGSPESINIDNPNLIGLEFNRSVSGGPFTSSVIDVRRYQSYQMSVQYEAANAGPPANTGVVTIEWGDQASFGNTVWRETFEINSINSTDCGRTIILDGMHGQFMRYTLAAGNGAGSTFTLVLYGSNRSVDRLRVFELAPTNTKGMSTDGVQFAFNESVPAVTTIQRNIRIGNGNATMTIQTPTGGGPWDLILYSPQLGVNAARFWSMNAIAAQAEIRTQITIPSRCLTAHIRNGHATVAASPFFTLTREK